MAEDSRSFMRWAALGAVALAGVAAWVGASTALGHGPTAAAEAPVFVAPAPTHQDVTVAPTAPADDTFIWRETLLRLDRVRARAIAQRDRSLLADVYAPGSAASSTDAQLIEDLVDQGTEVQGLRTTIVATSVVSLSEGRVELNVRDRRNAYRLVGNHPGRVASSGTRSWRVVLSKQPEGYRIAEVAELS